MISNTQAFIYGMELATLALCCMYPAKTLEFVDYLLYNLQVNMLILSVRGCNLALYVRGWMMYRRLRREFAAMGLEIGPYKFIPLQDRDHG